MNAPISIITAPNWNNRLTLFLDCRTTISETIPRGVAPVRAVVGDSFGQCKNNLLNRCASNGHTSKYFPNSVAVDTCLAGYRLDWRSFESFY